MVIFSNIDIGKFESLFGKLGTLRYVCIHELSFDSFFTYETDKT